MRYTIELSENRKYFIIKTMGPITIDIVRQWTPDIDRRSRETGIQRFLFDARLSNVASSILENYHFAHHESATLNMQKNTRSAILILEGDKSHDFVETTLRNAGFSVRLFTDKLSAVKWLEE